MRKEKVGEIFALSSGILHGLFPIMINYSVGLMPAVFYAGMTNLIAAVLFLIYIIISGKSSDLFRHRAWVWITIVSFFIVIIPSLFIFVGTKHTSSINTAILSQAEILFTFIICGLFFGEIITKQKILGGVIIALGAIAVLYNGQFALNKGDLLIIAGTIFYPIGNHYAKKTLEVTSARVLMFLRSLIGGAVLLMISLLVEKTGGITFQLLQIHWFQIVINSVLIIFFGKILWYQALHRLDVTKAIPIISSSPAFSLIFAAIFLREIPSVYQLVGLAVIMFGLWQITRQENKHATAM